MRQEAYKVMDSHPPPLNGSVLTTGEHIIYLTAAPVLDRGDGQNIKPRILDGQSRGWHIPIRQDTAKVLGRHPAEAGLRGGPEVPQEGPGWWVFATTTEVSQHFNTVSLLIYTSCVGMSLTLWRDKSAMAQRGPQSPSCETAEPECGPRAATLHSPRTPHHTSC